MARAKRHYKPGYVWHTPVKQSKKRFNGVNYPSGCAFGYDPTGRCQKREFFLTKRKKILINYEKLKELLGFDSYEHVKTAHNQWVESCLSDGDNFRGGKWTESIAVGSESFIQNVKMLMGGMALGRKVLETGESFQLKEVQYPYPGVQGHVSSTPSFSACQ